MTQLTSNTAKDRRRRPRVLHVAYNLSTGGAENIVATLATRLNAGGFEVEVASLTHGGAIADRLVAEGMPVHIIHKKVGIDPGAAIRLRRLISRGAFALVHTHDPPPNLWTVAACVLMRRPPRIVQTEHGPLLGSLSSPYNRIRRLVARRNALILGVSEIVTESHRSAGRLEPSRYRTVQNGIAPPHSATEEERRQLRHELQLPAEAKVIGTVGNLRAPKAHRDLLDALAQVVPGRPNLHTIVAGEGVLRDELVAHTRALGLEGRIHWLGSRSDVGALLSIMDLFVMSSRSEGLPLAMLEAVAVGVPVISTDVGGISEVIEDGVTGTLVSPANPAELARAIEKRLDDPAGARALAIPARQRFESTYTAEAMVRSVEKLYNEVLGRGV